MKKIRENAVLLLKFTVIAAFALFCLTKTTSVRNAVSEAVVRCLETVIPSLYAMLIVSGILINSGIIGKLPQKAALPARFFLRMESDVFYIFAFSQFAGYPVGAKMLCSAYENGTLSKSRAERLMGVCYGAGPAFIFGCISSQLYSGNNAGIIILISCSAANLIIAFFIGILSGKTPPTQKKHTDFRFSASMLTESIVSGGRSMAVICFMIMAFSVVTALLSETGLTDAVARIIAYSGAFPSETAQGFTYAFLDVTAVNNLPHGNYRILPVVSALTAFGGVCVLLQIAAITAGKLSLKYMIVSRAAASVLSGILTCLITPFFIAEETVSAASSSVSVTSASSPIPSLLLIIMTFSVFAEYERLMQKNIHSEK